MPTLRLPHNGSRWVWEIDKEHARALLEVKEVRFNGERWWVTTYPLSEPDNLGLNDLDRFWEAVTPIGGRVEDLSNPISQEQYKGSSPLA